MAGPETNPPGASCPNCGKPVTEDDVFCSLACERAWLKRESSKAESEGILFCPKCGNMRLQLAIPGLITIWKCSECGYEGSLAVKDGAMRSKIHEEYERKRGHE